MHPCNGNRTNHSGYYHNQAGKNENGVPPFSQKTTQAEGRKTFLAKWIKNISAFGGHLKGFVKKMLRILYMYVCIHFIVCMHFFTMPDGRL